MKHSYIIGAVMVVLMAVVFFFGFLGDDAVKAQQTQPVTIDVDKKADVAIIITDKGKAECWDIYKDNKGNLAAKECKLAVDPDVKLKKIKSGFHASSSCYVCWGGDCYSC